MYSHPTFTVSHGTTVSLMSILLHWRCIYTCTQLSQPCRLPQGHKALQTFPKQQLRVRVKGENILKQREGLMPSLLRRWSCDLLSQIMEWALTGFCDLGTQPCFLTFHNSGILHHHCNPKSKNQECDLHLSAFRSTVSKAGIKVKLLYHVSCPNYILLSKHPQDSSEQIVNNSMK